MINNKNNQKKLAFMLRYSQQSEVTHKNIVKDYLQVSSYNGFF